MSADTYLLKVHYCIGTKRQNSVIKKIKLAIQEGLTSKDLKEMIKNSLKTDRKITIIASHRVKKWMLMLYFR